MTKASLLPLCLGIGLLIGGCTPTTSEWTPAEAPKTTRIEYVRLQHETAFKPGSAELVGGEAEGLSRFLDQSEVTSEDHVYFEPAEGDRLAAGRIGRLTKVVDRRGIGAQSLPPALSGVAADRIRVVVERYVVIPPDCPNWTSPAVGDHGNQPGSNFGCADATNLSLMVADPRDLMIGRPLGPPQGDAALYAVDRYRQGKPKEPTPMSASKVYAPQGAGGPGAAGGAGAGGAGGQ
jgi:pilus assembly protein CpaD